MKGMESEARVLKVFKQRIHMIRSCALGSGDGQGRLGRQSLKAEGWLHRPT